MLSSSNSSFVTMVRQLKNGLGSSFWVPHSFATWLGFFFLGSSFFCYCKSVTPVGNCAISGNYISKHYYSRVVSY